jgi:hypothetical protein
MKIKEDYNISTDDVSASIKSVDEKLAIAKEAYAEAHVDKKNKWMNIIDQLLDDRISLMEMRDIYCS